MRPPTRAVRSSPPRQLGFGFTVEGLSRRRPEHRPGAKLAASCRGPRQLAFPWPCVWMLDEEVVAATTEAVALRSRHQVRRMDLLWSVAAIEAVGRVRSPAAPLAPVATIPAICASIPRAHETSIGRMVRALLREGSLEDAGRLPRAAGCRGRPMRAVRLSEAGRAELHVEMLTDLAEVRTAEAKARRLGFGEGRASGAGR